MRADYWVAYNLQQGGSTVRDCAANGDMYGLKRLLNLGGDVEEMDTERNTALHYAAEAGPATISLFLLTHISVVDYR